MAYMMLVWDFWEMTIIYAQSKLLSRQRSEVILQVVLLFLLWGSDSTAWLGMPLADWNKAMSPEEKYWPIAENMVWFAAIELRVVSLQYLKWFII